jgi:hypothetical protein
MIIVYLLHTIAADFSFPAFFADTLVRIYFIHTCTSILTRVQLTVIDICNGQTTHKLKLSTRRKSEEGSLGINYKFTFQLHRLKFYKSYALNDIVV